MRYELGPPRQQPRAEESDDEDGNVESVGDDDDDDDGDDEFDFNNGNSSSASAQAGGEGCVLPRLEKENDEDFFIGASGTTKAKTRSALAGGAARGGGGDANTDDKSAFAGFDGARGGGRVGGRSPGPLAASVSRLSM